MLMVERAIAQRRMMADYILLKEEIVLVERADKNIRQVVAMADQRNMLERGQG